MNWFLFMGFYVVVCKIFGGLLSFWWKGAWFVMVGP